MVSLVRQKITVVRQKYRTYVKDESTWHEASNPYYQYYEQEKICNMILHEFNLYSDRSHIINGHTPVRTSRGEHPVRANGRLMVIDGGFCKSYHKTTGIARYPHQIPPAIPERLCRTDRK